MPECNSCKQIWRDSEVRAVSTLILCESCFSRSMGCPWIVGTKTEIIKGVTYRTKKFCRCIPSPTSLLCPKHETMDEGKEGDVARRMEKARNGKEKKKLFADALAESPLRADNPQFAQGGVDKTYSR